jgi:hypothetical protein
MIQKFWNRIWIVIKEIKYRLTPMYPTIPLTKMSRYWLEQNKRNDGNS